MLFLFLQGDCLFWPPVQFINFYYLPTTFRVVYINLATVIFDVYLAYVKHYDTDSTAHSNQPKWNKYIFVSLAQKCCYWGLSGICGSKFVLGAILIRIYFYFYCNLVTSFIHLVASYWLLLVVMFQNFIMSTWLHIFFIFSNWSDNTRIIMTRNQLGKCRELKIYRRTHKPGEYWSKLWLTMLIF